MVCGGILVAYRIADPKTELKQIYDLHEEVFVHELGGKSCPLDDEYSEGATYLVAECGGKIVGTVTMSAYDENPQVNVAQLVVRKEYRSSGIGHFLMIYAEKWSRKKGYPYCTVGCTSGLVSFYQPLGYRVTEPEAVAPDGTKFVPMVKKL